MNPDPEKEIRRLKRELRSLADIINENRQESERRIFALENAVEELRSATIGLHPIGLSQQQVG